MTEKIIIHSVTGTRKAWKQVKDKKTGGGYHNRSTTDLLPVIILN